MLKKILNANIRAVSGLFSKFFPTITSKVIIIIIALVQCFGEVLNGVGVS